MLRSLIFFILRLGTTDFAVAKVGFDSFFVTSRWGFSDGASEFPCEIMYTEGTVLFVYLVKRPLLGRVTDVFYIIALIVLYIGAEVLLIHFARLKG